MDTGGAISAIKAGHKVRREAWDNPDQYVCLDGIDSLKLVGGELADGTTVGGDGGTARTYTAGPNDLLAEDWRFVNLPDTGDATAGGPLAQRVYASHADDNIKGPTIPQENIDNDNVTFVDTASGTTAPILPQAEAAHIGREWPYGDDFTVGRLVNGYHAAQMGDDHVHDHTD